jgi:hypothetical protein
LASQPSAPDPVGPDQLIRPGDHLRGSEVLRVAVNDVDDLRTVLPVFQGFDESLAAEHGLEQNEELVAELCNDGDE